MQKADPLPAEVVALCALLSRIMYRCLVEQDARFLALLVVPTSNLADNLAGGSGGSHEQAA